MFDIAEREADFVQYSELPLMLLLTKITVNDDLENDFRDTFCELDHSCSLGKQVN